MTSGLTAVIKGAEYLLLNKADAMICGGNEMLFDFIMSKYDRLDLLSSGNNEKEQCRPFDDKRNGIMLGEGACYFTLESKRREAEPLAEMINYSYNFNPDKNSTIDAFIECMKESLHVNGEDYTNKVDLVVADGSGDLEMDMLIATAISKTFSHNPYVTSNKGCIGHTLGASGAFNLLDGILCLQNQALLPIQNLLDPILPLNFVTEYQEAAIDNVLVTSVDPDGNNACILLKKA
jgi:3-oxoacyl-[acyl-carrier-protein] synthase-1